MNETIDAIETEAATQLTPKAAAEALSVARAKLQAARQRLADLEDRNRAASAAAETARAERGRVAFAASQGNATAKKALDKHTAAERAAANEASNLALAIPRAEALLQEAEEAEQAAFINDRIAKVDRLLADEFLPAAKRIDAIADEFAAAIKEREAVLSRIGEAGGLDGIERQHARFSEKMLLTVVHRPLEGLRGLEGLSRALKSKRFPGARTSMVEIDARRAETIRTARRNQSNNRQEVHRH